MNRPGESLSRAPRNGRLMHANNGVLEVGRQKELNSKKDKTGRKHIINSLALEYLPSALSVNHLQFLLEARRK